MMIKYQNQSEIFEDKIRDKRSAIDKFHGQSLWEKRIEKKQKHWYTDTIEKKETNERSFNII